MNLTDMTLRRQKLVRDALPDLRCGTCNNPMKGIKANDCVNKRIDCESCGGNESEHNKDNPLKFGESWKKQRQIRWNNA